MDRRDFLKTTVTFAALAPLASLADAVAKASGAAAAKAAMTRRPLGKSGVMLPLLGFGGMRLPRRKGSPEIDVGEVRRMVARAFEGGCNYFDTAFMYHGGRSERCFGEVLRDYPRDSYFLADKMPVWMAKSADDVRRIFEEQLSRCRTEYFDCYLIHSLDAGKWRRAKEFKVYEFLSEMKKQGKIRHLGFSFHDSPEVLQEIAAERQWDFAQIQLNYLDWELYRSREQYEILTKAGIPVIVMEPLRGGALANLSPEATAVLKNAAPDASNASWAFRYAGSLPNVVCILSGMTRMEHLEENLRTFSPLVPLTDPERATLDLALAAYRKQLAVPCTSCRYCMPCPVGVEIPKIFAFYNQYKLSNRAGKFREQYNSLPEGSRADACVACGACAKVCPQKIHIPEELAKIARLPVLKSR